MNKVLRLSAIFCVVLFITACEPGDKAPITVIISGPTNPTGQTTASFNFVANKGGCSFQCELDWSGWVPCSAPQNYTGLTAGSHTFSVKATDDAGKTEDNPPIVTWVIDTLNPITTIVNKPANPTGLTTAVFTFTANKDGCTFQCKLDGGAWEACASPKEYSDLAPASYDLSREPAALVDGSHTFSVKATDGGGNVEITPPSYTWFIDTTNPITTLLTFPGNVTSMTSAVFTFEANKPGCTFQCQLDAGEWLTCSSGQSYSGLALGPHVFAVKATDDAGRKEIVPQEYDWVIIPESWIPTSQGVNLPTARYYFTAIWTGSEMIIWGGSDGHYANTGGRYDPATDSWTRTSTGDNVPQARSSHSAIWTGTEMIVWGGYGSPSAAPEAASANFEISRGSPRANLNSGGRYNPTTNSWAPTSMTNAPVGRVYHTAVWTESEMILWGGMDNAGTLNTGGRYNPDTDSWTPTSDGYGVPTARQSHTAVWTGSEMIIWGGYSNPYLLNTGGSYDPGTDSWSVLKLSSAPTARYSHTAVWTGSEMIVWGGLGPGGVHNNTGGRYDPNAESWTPTSTGTNVPKGRWRHTAVWNGTVMIVWGGEGKVLTELPKFEGFELKDVAGYISGTPPATAFLNTGGRYDPSNNSWTPTSMINVPVARNYHTAVWTGNEMIVWGGNNSTYDLLASGGRYFP